ncbi:MAG: hypothetical protein QM594_06650 [Niabella sp.]
MMQTKKPFAYGIKNKQILFNFMLALLAASLLMVSCSKQDTVEHSGLKANTLAASFPSDGVWYGIVGPTGSNTAGDVRKDGSVYSVRNFHQDYSGSPSFPHIGSGNFFWNFGIHEGTSDTGYDINFTGIATGDIKTTAAIGELRFKDKAFASVVAADWSTATPGDNYTIGMDSVTHDPGQPPAPPFVQAYANGKGWYDYHWTDHSVRPVAGRTLLFKRNGTPDRYWKIEVSDIYLNNVFKGSFAYYHFKYQEL